MEQSKQASTVDRAEPRLLRKLVSYTSWLCTNWTSIEGTSVSGRYAIPKGLSGSGAESRNELVQAVENAIAQIILRHTVLQVAIADAESQSPKFVQLETPEKYGPDAVFENDLQDLLANQVDATFPGIDKRPGWTIVVIHFQATQILEIVFTYNHPHCDGISGKVFHSDLLKALNSVGKDAENGTDDGSIIKLPESAPVLPPTVEGICKLPLTIPFILKTAWKEWGPTSFNAALARWAPVPPRSSPFKTQVRAFVVEAEPLDKILLACRKHETTLTGLLHILTLTSLASQLTQEAAPAFLGGTTVDRRRYVDPKDFGKAYPGFEPKNTMGNYVTFTSHEFERGIISQFRSLMPSPTNMPDSPKAEAATLSPALTSLIWSTAAKVRRDLEDRVKTGLKNSMVGMLKLVSDFREEMARAARRPRQFSWWVTGLGVLDPVSSNSSDIASPPAATVNDEDVWTTRRAQFVLSTETTAAALNISPMTVAGERLVVGGSWQDCLFDVSFGERVMADLEAWLGQIA